MMNRYEQAIPWSQLLLVFTLVIGVSACAMPNATATKAAARASGELSASEILTVVKTLNDGEIKQAELALNKSDHTKVRETAELIIRDHKASNKQIESTLAAVDGAPKETTLSNGLKMQADEIAEELKALSGSEFDCTYLQKQADLHRVALDTVRSELLPDTENRQVREVLVAATPALEQHRKSAVAAREEMKACSAR